MCPIPNDFRDRAIDIIARIKERQDAFRRATRHVLTRVAKYTEIFVKCIILAKLYLLCHFNNKYRYYKRYVISLSYL
jgi:hypothetical protein